jgi:hypothetical protein
MTKINSADSMFEGIENLKYINLYKVKDANNIITNSHLQNIKGLTVCQQEKLFTNENIIDKCCLFNIETNQCEYTNYITLYYKEDVNY